MAGETSGGPRDFIRQRIADDVATGKNGGRVVTRFPPEPNGYLHIGHAKSICLNFGVAREWSGRCHLRFDDTNPTAEDVEYVDSIQRDVRWLGFEWGEHLYFASDYYQRLHDYAVELIRRGKAFVCDLTADQIREYRGTLKEPGRNSPWRDRGIEENLDLFARMRAGEFAQGSRTLRAKIDMGSPVIVMRDPVIYRIQKAHHHRTGDQWCIYPMYDFAHCLSDMIEGISHSLCTLEFSDNRTVYDWILDQLETPCHPQQIEFARLNLTYTVMSKRVLKRLVQEGHVDGWEDPRMPTLSGMRRRGFTPEAIREFCESVGIARSDNTVQYEQLEFCLRKDLNAKAPRVMAVLEPLRVVIENYPEGQVEQLEAVNNPENPEAGKRQVPFSRVIYVEREDFMENPPSKFYRLSPGREVRLRYAYFITCKEVLKDPKTGEVVELRCTYDPATRGGDSPDGRKVKATIHWVAAEQSLSAEVRVYEHLFAKPDPYDLPPGGDVMDNLNPGSRRVLTDCRVEPCLAEARDGDFYQFERKGYFSVDRDSRPGRLVFNRTTTLRDTWAKVANKQ